MSSTRVRLGDLASQLGLVLEGDPDLEISGVASIDVATADDLVFVRAASFASLLEASPARAVVAPVGLPVGGRSALRSDDPSRDFYRAARILVPEPTAAPGIHPSAVVADDAKVDPTASIGALCAVGARAEIGPRTVLHPGVVLYDSVRVGADCVLHARCVVAAASVLGDRVVLQPGVVIGGDGFGYVGHQGGGLAKIHNVGRVWLEDDVEIGANSTIDRGTLGDTRIGRGTKIDNLVQIGHNCTLGERCIVVAQAGIAGSTALEPGVVLLAQAGIAGHKRIGAQAFIGPQSGVHKDVPAGARVLGSPQRLERAFHREMAALARLPDLVRRVRRLERGKPDAGEGEA
ncbi:MAG TPA: UDP-3-O-(3-hydroxymyristoyl)glucosamine N-acyltransferase [Myxococcota bacterium]|nr:UDP-3-O-(3-hydroxymyristoyl)glucosamine N-acyltransferase [Myxococcota bacterium]